MALLKDILQTKDKGGSKYSQGRVYLFISFVAYYIFLGFLAFKAVSTNMLMNVTAPQTIIDALQWSIMLFAGYVFGAKGLEIIKFLGSLKKSGNGDGAAPSQEGGNPVTPA